MPDWRDGLQKGSFKGVPFLFETREKTGGRRSVAHEFPQREDGQTDDQGRRLAKFTLDLFILGEDYFAQRDALEEVLNSPGPGELVDPFLGRQVVQADQYTLTETRTEGRIARFTVNFTEAGQAKFPETVNDDLQNILDKATEFVDGAVEAFSGVFNVINTASHVVDQASEDIGRTIDFIEVSVAKFTTPLSNLNKSLQNLRDQKDVLLRLPSQLAGQFSAIFTELAVELADNPDILVSIFGNFNLLDDQFEEIVGDTPSNVSQIKNRNAAVDFNKQLAHAGRANAITEVDFKSVDAAVLERDGLFDDLTEQLEKEEISDDLFQNIRDLQAALVKAIPTTEVGDLIEFQINGTVPALVVSQILFGNIEKEQEIIDENNVEHPGFIPSDSIVRVSGV